MAVHFDKNKFLDLCNFLLVISLIIFIVRFSSPLMLPFIQSKIKHPVNSGPSISKSAASEPETWGRDRKFPPFFTESEKILLTEQKHDYERTTPEMEEEYQKYLKIRETLPVRSPSITIFRNGNDCFVRPTIIKVKPGQKLLIINPSDTIVNLGMAGEVWNVPAGGQLSVKLKLNKTEPGQRYWGYSCSDLGLAGYFVLDN